MMRWQPKQWTRPRSRAWREARDPGPPSAVMKEMQRILKRLYASDPTPETPEMARPPWAQLARKHGWMTRGAYLAVREEPTGRMLPARPGLREFLYRQSPVLGLRPKHADFGGGSSPMTG